MRNHRRRFYSSPSCDGDRSANIKVGYLDVSILPRLATGINVISVGLLNIIVSILPRLATGIRDRHGREHFLYVSILPRLATGILASSDVFAASQFLFFPVLRRGSPCMCI